MPSTSQPGQACGVSSSKRPDCPWIRELRKSLASVAVTFYFAQEPSGLLFLDAGLEWIDAQDMIKHPTIAVDSSPDCGWTILQQWARAAVTKRGLVKTFCSSILSLVLMEERSYPRWGVLGAHPIGQGTVSYHLRKQKVWLLPVTINSTRPDTAIFFFGMRSSNACSIIMPLDEPPLSSLEYIDGFP